MTTPNNCPCGSLYLPKGKAFSASGLRINVAVANSITELNLLHSEDIYLESGEKLVTVTPIVREHIIPNSLSISHALPISINNVIQVVVKEKLSKSILGTQYIGKYNEATTINSIAVDLHSSMDLYDNAIIIEINSLCDNGSDPCCDKLPSTIDIVGPRLLCVPLEQYYVLPTTTTTTTPEPFVIEFLTHPTNQTVNASNKATFSFSAITIYDKDFKYWWEKTTDNGSSWQKASRLLEGKSRKIHTLLVLATPPMNNIKYRVVTIEPKIKYSNVATLFTIQPATTTTTTTTFNPVTTTLPPCDLQIFGSDSSVTTTTVAPGGTTTTTTPTSYTLHYLVVGGGGGGGGVGYGTDGFAGGGGGGGLRTSWGSISGGGSSVESTISLPAGASVNVTVGSGGNGGASLVTVNASNGENSTFYTITSYGGGGGNFQGGPEIMSGSDGGCGGGGGGATGNARLGGFGSQGYDGGRNYTSSSYGSGGGGGAGGRGGDGTGTSSGNGGLGITSNITGSSIGYAGGGAGTGNLTYSLSDGNASHGGGVNTNGIENTGGGGSGSSGVSWIGYSGGSGVVIIRIINGGNITVGSSLTYTKVTVGIDTVYIFTSGSDTITF